MPKEKRRNVTGNSTRHAPLGQVIADDENRSKYATVRSRPRKDKGNTIDIDNIDDDGTTTTTTNGNGNSGMLLDEKSSNRIFELGKAQLLEIELEEQQQMEGRKKKKKQSVDSDDEDDDDEDGEEEGSIIGDVDEEEK